MLLEVEKLNIHIPSRRGVIHAVRDLDFSVEAGQTLGIVGESGCGKSITSLALMGLLPSYIKLKAQRLGFAGEEILSLSARKRRALRGKRIAMIFQDPMTALNPSFTIGFQLEEVIKAHCSMNKAGRGRRLLELLNQVGIADPSTQLAAYPHQLSGGMCQRVMIAMAIAGEPDLLIADEPTTALDVTIQAQILELLSQLQQQRGMAMVFITHDLGVVHRLAHRLLVMYAGEGVEYGPCDQVLGDPSHPYTAGLLSSLPENQSHAAADGDAAPIPHIPGMVADLRKRSQGCAFQPRCGNSMGKCATVPPPVSRQLGRRVLCHSPHTGFVSG